jgi:predicted enzyme related to lactoylglutathione lyase
MDKRPIMHVEIPTLDRAGTADFYFNLFGWESGPIGEDSPYTGFAAGNMSGGFPDLNGGLREVTSKMNAGDVILYVPSNDLELDLTKVESLGGTVLLARTQVDEDMWVALFRDPNGACIALATSKPAL